MKIIKGSWLEKDKELTQDVIDNQFIFINSNGSKWGGEEPDDITELCECLKKEALDPDFENYGNFIIKNPCSAVMNPKWTGFTSREPQWIDGKQLFNTGGVFYFFGNFFSVSHLFSIYTNDLNTIKTLTDLIRANQETASYKDAKKRIENKLN